MTRPSPSQSQPPAIAAWLLQWLLDRASVEAVAGDLHEGYVRLRHERGARAAAWWYWLQALRSIVTCRLTGARHRDVRLADCDAGSALSVRDLARPALRQFRDKPLYSAACVITLALAVGMASVSFAVVKRAFIDALPYRNGDELVSVLTLTNTMTSAVSPHAFEDLRASQSPFVEYAPIRPIGFAYQTPQLTENVVGNLVTTDYFKMLDVTPALGRLWTDGERDAIVVSHVFWRDRLGSASDVIGRAVVLDGQPRTIVGVLAPDFMPPYFVVADLWAPLDLAPLLTAPRTVRTLTLLARRAPAQSALDVDAFLTLFTQQLQQRFPTAHGGHSIIARPLRQELVGSVRPALIGTGAAAALLLLIVGANIAGLSTAHAVAARQQLAIRAALGATPRRLFAEQAVESLALAVVGSSAGVALAYALTAVVARYQQYFLARLVPVGLDLTTVGIALGVGTVVGLSAALIPRSIVSARPADTLRASRGGSGDVKVTAARSGLVVAQVALALVLLVGAGLLVRTVRHLATRDLGFDSGGITSLQVTLAGPRYQAMDAQLQFERDVLERLRQIPGVRTAMASVGFPLWGGMMAGLHIKGDAAGTAAHEVAYLSVSPGFARDIGAQIVAGRDLEPSDIRSAPRVVVINETMARMFWPQGNALGAEVYIGPGPPGDQWITVVGIMADMRTHGLVENIRPTAFGSTQQYSWPRRHVAVRTAGAAPATLAMDLKSAVTAVDPTVAIGALSPAEQALTNSMAQYRLMMLALTLFSVVAVVLCISGLYAVIALSSQQRRREYAIRLALGARRGAVRWMVARQALVLGGAGAVAGLAAAAFGTRALQGMLHGVQPLDLPTFAAAGLALLVLAAFAAWQPASQAERVDPVETLRAE